MRAAALLALLAAPAAAQDASFQAPSGNIHCLFLGAEVRCDVLEADGPPPPAPAWCDLAFGHAYAVGATGPGAALCAGDTVANPSAPVLGYGSTVERGGVACTVERSGVACVNAQGHGFSLSRSSRRAF